MTQAFSKDFGPFESRAWLNCAHQRPPPRVAVEAAEEALAWKWKIAPHRLTDDSFNNIPQRMKRALGQVIGASPEEIQGGTNGYRDSLQALVFTGGDQTGQR
jgi:cysteine desulfurase/selenocysteine lyase